MMIALPAELDPRHIRVGCDVVAISDVEASVSEFGDRYLRKVFTTGEIEDCRGADRIARLAARFAAKEAVIKAFLDPRMAFPLREIEVTKRHLLPTLRLSGSVARRARQQGWTSTSLSLSHADCHAMALLVVACDPPTVSAALTGGGRR